MLAEFWWLENHKMIWHTDDTTFRKNSLENAQLILPIASEINTTDNDAPVG